MYEADRIYRFRVSRVARIGAFKYLPRDEHTGPGSTLTKLIEENGDDVIASAEPV